MRVGKRGYDRIPRERINIDLLVRAFTNILVIDRLSLRGESSWFVRRYDLLEFLWTVGSETIVAQE